MRNHLLKVDLAPVSSLYHHSALYITTLPKLCQSCTGLLGPPFILNVINVRPPFFLNIISVAR
ncbi:hypothetical protein BDN67DRAFT_1016297 [Paxillus ammoniavirescens]|nr:hypothetical protein BDN67DRAFT_1016297 [Paxillus ammoniavirescens]